jgi:hypothetical protein
MEEVGRVFDVSRHEAGHAFAYWLFGGRVKTVVAARSGFDNDVVPTGYSGCCGGEFRDSSLVMGEASKTLGEKMLAVLFAGGIAEQQNASGTTGDMQMAITAMGWPAHRYPAAGRDAFVLVEKYGEKEIPIEDRIAFFKKHFNCFADILQDDDAQAAITALTDALDQAPGHTIRGRDAVGIFEKIYAGKLPEGVLPRDYHGDIGDRILSPKQAIDDCQFHLNFILKRLDDANIDDRLELARIAVIQALLKVSALM